MHITRILLKGFKTYENVEVKDFDPGFNIVVGRNGSGKSNFMHAIRFVLHDSDLGIQDKTSLIHETKDKSRKVLTAFVEIEFDNTDRRFPVEEDKLILRREIGSKKQEYSLNLKSIKKDEVMNILESAGFSRSNPYYIVEQGRILKLALAKDEERLLLLEEIAGTKVYKEKRKESLAILEASDDKIKKIEDLLEHVEVRLAELKEEKNELKEYIELDKEKRSSEYAIFEKERIDIEDQLAEMKKRLITNELERTKLHNDIQAVASQVKQLEAEIKSYKNKRDEMEAERIALNEALSNFTKEANKAELDLEDAENKTLNQQSQIEQCNKDISSVQKKIASNEKRLESLKPEMAEATEEQTAISKALAKDERRQEELLTKKGRAKQFQNQKQRDAFLSNDKKGILESIQSREKQIKRQQEAISKIEKDISAIESNEEANKQELERLKKDSEQANIEHSSSLKMRDDAMNEQKAAWKREQEASRRFEALRSEFSNHEKSVEFSMSKDTYIGLKTVQKIARDHQIRGVIGPVYDLFKCRRELNTAVEVTAGNSLYHVVVDTDKTAAEILKKMNETKSGRITFIPLNQLKTKKMAFPNEQGASPLIEELTLDLNKRRLENYQPSQLQPVLQHIFGRTLICDNLTTAQRFSASTPFNCILLDGDKVSNKGILTGGFQDRRKSRLMALENMKRSQDELVGLKSESVAIEKDAKEKLENVNRLSKEVEAKGRFKRDIMEKYDGVKSDIRSNNQALRSKKQNLDKMTANLDSAMQSNEIDLEKVEAIDREMATPMLTTLSDEESNELNSLSDKITHLRRELTEKSKRFSKIEAEKDRIETLLNSNLKVQKEELEQQLSDLQFSSSSSSPVNEIAKLVVSRREDIEKCEAEIAALEKKDLKIADSLKKREEALKKQQDRLKELKSKRSGSASQDKMKQQHLNDKRKELLDLVREHGSVPEDAFKYQKMSMKALHKQLHQCNEKLKKYAHVNKKSHDQYRSFKKQGRELLARKEELIESHKEIDKLIKHLDCKEDEAINLTFVQVQQYFSEIFSELTLKKNGKAELVMKTKEIEGKTKYVGVGMKITFNGKQFSSAQLVSGGEKSVVAIALIFAIQKCDPAPFYIFDEIDQAMDVTYREKIAERMHHLASKKNGTQFIATTFHKQMVETCDKCFSVEINTQLNQSKMKPQDKKNIYNFIEEE